MKKAKKLMERLNNRATRTGIALTAGTAGALVISGVSGATGTVTEEQFTTAQTSLIQQMGWGAALLIAVTLFVTGITILVKWLTKSSRKTA